MSLSRRAAAVTLAWMVGCAGTALAADPHPAATDVQHANNPSVTVEAGAAYVDGFGHAVNADALGHYSGGSGLVQNNMNLTGAVTGDSASQVTTGSNSITGNAFAGESGLPSVIQNSGNNVLIQNGVIVNVQMKP
jgi:hypothetical protein